MGQTRGTTDPTVPTRHLLFSQDSFVTGSSEALASIDAPWRSPESPEPTEPGAQNPSDTALFAGAPTPPRSPAGRRLCSLPAKPTPLWKRSIDLIFAGAALLVLSPLFAIIAAAIKLSSPGPVFFCQWRSGHGGVPFRMYKFRSMVADAEARKTRLLERNERDGPAFKIQNDPRVTRVGAILRRLSLDELPQLWNVLVGQMSLVGPRPLPCQEMARCDGWQRERLHVVPGLTCTWQAFPQRSSVPFSDWMRMDIRYVRNRSLHLDCLLLMRTVRRVVSDAFGTP